MGDMLKSLMHFVQVSKGNEGKLTWFANEFSAIITRRLENEGKTLITRLDVLQNSIEILSSIRTSLPNNDNVEKLTKLLFIECINMILSEGFRDLERTGTNVQLHNFKKRVRMAVNRLKHTGYSHRFELLQYLLDNNWKHPVLQQIMLNLPGNEEVAMEYVQRGETTEMFHVRVHLLVQSGYHDLALNLCNWCVKSKKYWYDSYLRAVQLSLLHNKGDMDRFTKQCQQLTCCKSLEIARQMKIDSDLYLTLLQTIMVQDWLRPSYHCCTKELLGLWLEARYQVEESEQGFLNSVSGLVHRYCTTWQLMSLIDVMHSKFGKHFMQFYLEVCLRVLRKEKSYLEEARALRKQKVIESQRSSLTYICTIINCVSVNWSLKLRRLAMLTAMSLEPSEEYVDIIESLYDTTDEQHDCHLVENTDNIQVDGRGRSYRRKKLTKFELRAAVMCSKDGYVFIPESSDLKQGNKTIRRRMLNDDSAANNEPQNLASGETSQQTENVQDNIKEEPTSNADCVCHVSDKCPCGKSPINNTAFFNGHITHEDNQKVTPSGSSDNCCKSEDEDKQLLSRHFVVRDVLPKTSQDLIDVLLELLCPDLHPNQPFEDLYHKCEAHLYPPPHSCIFEVFDGGMSPVGSDAEEVELFEIRPGATKWIFDGEDLDAPEPKIARGRPRKKVIYEEIDDRTSDSDTDRADSQYSGSTVVNSPMSVSTETEEFEIHINEDDDTTDSQDLQAMAEGMSKGIKDVTKRETMFSNFERIRDKIKKSKVASNTNHGSVGPMQRNVPSNVVEQSQRAKAIAEYMKGKQRQEYHAAESRAQSEANSGYKPNTFHDYSLAHKEGHLQKQDVIHTQHSENANLNFPTWDAALRNVVSSSTTNQLKEYRIPKKPSDNQPTTSLQNTEAIPSRNPTHTIAHPRGAPHTVVSHSGAVRPPASSHPQLQTHRQQLHSISGQNVPSASISHTSVSMGRTLNPVQHYPVGQTGLSAVQQLASKPPNKSLVSTVGANRTIPPTTGVVGTHQQAPAVAQTRVSIPRPQNQPFTQFTQAASYRHSQPRNPIAQEGLTVRPATSQHSAAMPQRTHISMSQQTAVQHGSSLVDRVNQRLPANVTVHSVKTQHKPPGAPLTPGKATVVSLSPAQIKAGQTSLGQEAITQPTVYLGSFVADPKKPWPCMSAPEVSLQLDSPVSQPKVQVYHSTHPSQPSVSLPPKKSAIHRSALDAQNIHQKGQPRPQQKAPKEVDSDIEIYLTHRSPVVPSKSDINTKNSQPEVVVVPQIKIKEKDIENEQLNILSTIREKMGLGDKQTKSKEALPNQMNNNSSSIGSAQRAGTKNSGLENLQSQIGMVIENVIKSDQFRQRDKVNSSTISSHGQSEKGTLPTPHSKGQMPVAPKHARVVANNSKIPDNVLKANERVEKSKIIHCDISGKTAPSKDKAPDGYRTTEGPVLTKESLQDTTRTWLPKDAKQPDQGNDKKIHPDISTEKVDDPAESDDDSGDVLPRDGNFKMMALSPKSSSVKVLEGTNVHELLESLQGSSCTVPQEVVRAVHLKLNKDESIEDVLLKMEGSAQSGDKPTRATPGTKRTEKVAWGCSFKQGVYAVEVSKDRSRKQTFSAKKISKEELENEPISKMANKEGVKLFAIQVKKSSRSGSGRSTPALDSSKEEEANEKEESPKEVPATDTETPIKPMRTTKSPLEQTFEGKETDRPRLGVGSIDSSLLPSTSTSVLSSVDKKSVISETKSGKSDDKKGERTVVVPAEGGNNSTEQKSKVPSRSPDQVVTVRPQFGRLIPELSPSSQRVNLVTVASSTNGTVKAKFTVSGTAQAPHLKPGESPEVPITQPITEKHSTKTETTKNEKSSTETMVPFSSSIPTSSTKSGATNEPLPSVQTIPTISNSCYVTSNTSVISSVVPAVTSATVESKPERSTNLTSLSNLPADAKVTKVIMHPCNANVAKVHDVPARMLNQNIPAHPATNDSSRSSFNITHDIAEWGEVVAFFKKHDNYTCKICSKHHATKKMMGMHVSKTHSQVLHVDDGYICPFCEDDFEHKFPTFEEIKAHMETKHRRTVRQSVPSKGSAKIATPNQVSLPKATSQNTSDSKTSEIPERPESPSSVKSSPPAKLKPIDSSSDDEISFKLTAAERDRVLDPHEWPPSPDVNTEDTTDEKQEVTKRGRTRKTKLASTNAATSKRGKRKNSRSPDTKHKNAASKPSKSSKENDENTPQFRKRSSKSPPGHKKRKASPSPTSSLPGRPARKNTLNQRLQQRRHSEEIGSTPGKHANQSDSSASPENVSKAKIRKQNSSEYEETAQGEEKCIKIEESSGANCDEAVDLNESAHVSVIKRNKSPETYQKFFKLTDWAKHAEEQKREWEEVINNAPVDQMVAIKDEPVDTEHQGSSGLVKKGSATKVPDIKVEPAEHNDVTSNKDNSNRLTPSVECKGDQDKEKSQNRPASRSPMRHSVKSQDKKAGSPRSSLWSGNVKGRDWTKVKTYQRRSAGDKLCSIKRSRSEDEVSPRERQKRRKSEVKQSEDSNMEENTNSKTSDMSLSKNDNDTSRDSNDSLMPKTAQSSSMPRTSPCAVSIQRLNIKTIKGSSASSAESTVININMNEDNTYKVGKQAVSSNDSQPVILNESMTMANYVRSNDSERPSANESTVIMGGKIRSQRTSTGSTGGKEPLTQETPPSDEDKKLTSPPRVTRSRERSGSRGNSVISACPQSSPAKGQRDTIKTKDSSSQSLLKSKPKPVVIGGEVIGQPLSTPKRNTSADLSQPRRSSRPSTSQYSVNHRPGDDSKEDRKSRKR